MKIDIDKLNEAELIDLNNRVVARLKFLSEMRAHAHMLDFSIGEKVSFQPEGHPPAEWHHRQIQPQVSHGHHGERAAMASCANVPAKGRTTRSLESGFSASHQPAKEIGTLEQDDV